jgi:hypothetical protein
MFSASSLLGHFNLPITRPAGGERIVLTPNNEIIIAKRIGARLDHHVRRFDARVGTWRLRPA